MVTLGVVAAERDELLIGRSILDPLGHHAQAEAVAEVDGRGDQGRSPGVFGHRHDERPVEFELVDGKVTQVCQRAVAGAEVVDGDQDAGVAQPGQDGPGPATVRDQEVLGDLQREGRRLQASRFDHRDDAFG